jgi:ribosomal protein L11
MSENQVPVQPTQGNNGINLRNKSEAVRHVLETDGVDTATGIVMNRCAALGFEVSVTDVAQGRFKMRHKDDVPGERTPRTPRTVIALAPTVTAESVLLALKEMEDKGQVKKLETAVRMVSEACERFGVNVSRLDELLKTFRQLVGPGEKK